MTTIFDFKPIPTITPRQNTWENGTWKFAVPTITPISGGSPSWQDIVLSGNGSLTLTNAKANGLEYLKLFGGTEQRNLPKGHTQLEYVYMTSGSYIKIEDLLISSGYRIEYEFRTTTLGSSLRNFLGGRANGVSAGGGFRLSKLASGGTTLDRVVFYGFESGTEYYAPEQFQPNTRYKYTYNNGVCTLESGGSVVSTQTFTVTDNTSTKWGINTYVSNNDYWQTDTTDGVYAYSLKVWNEQGELVMDLVPDLTSSNVVCFYDTVTGNIREASGGTFEAGTITPIPNIPVNIISNNGVIKYSANMCNVNEQTVLIGYYISSSGVVTADNNNWIYQDFIPVKPNTTYTLTMSSSVYYVTISEYSTTDDSGFIIRKAGVSGDNTTLTITTESTTNYIRFGTNIDRSAVTLDRVLAIDWMLNVGNSMAYQPYVEGGIYTDGTTETVEVHTKNLYNPVTQTNNKFLNDSGAEVNNNNYSYTDYIAVKSGEQYTCQFVKTTGAPSGTLRIHGYNSSKVWVEKLFSSLSALEATITIPSGISYVRISWWNDTYSTDKQFEQGSTATTYEPYFNGGTATAEMLLKVGDYQDIQSVLDGEVTRNVGIKVMTGNETFITGTYGWISEDSITDQLNATYTPYCTHFAGTDTTPTYNSNTVRVYYTSGGTPRVYFGVNKTIYTSAEVFKQWLTDQYNAGNPVIIVYPLATQTTESVTAQPLTIQAGTNIIEITQASIDNLPLEVKYKGVI